MKRMLNTLYILSRGIYVKKEGEALVVRKDKSTLQKIPAVTLSSVVCFGNTRISPSAMHSCVAGGISISYLSVYGRFLARIQGPVSGNVLLRKEQYRKSDSPKESARIARTIVSAKIANSRMVFQRALRDHLDVMDAAQTVATIDKLSQNTRSVLEENDLDRIRGIEGDAARTYFESFHSLIVAQQNDFIFRDRNRRPPLDRINALLSFLYTLLYHDIRSALEAVGLDPAVGYLHRDRPGRMSLALDLMEEFRAAFADRLALSLINRRQISAADFRTTESGAILLQDAGRRAVVAAYQNRKQDEVTHPYLQEKMHIGLAFHAQAQLFARFIRGDMDGYPPFIWK